MPAESTTPMQVGSTVARGPTATSPVAVVWCRQVDNEAESPGYTTVPEEFPGHRETLDVIRIVGNLTVNVADTHDYWDPDPTQPLSYYPNLFLYPAYGGRYTCVGRMFLSTEDRPRLGMKTLVTGEFGPNILRWHASMGGPRREGSRPPPVPDAALYPVVGEGFLFHRGSTDPVLLVASEEWEPTMQAILELVRVLPASLISLGAILAFPYFLPQAKTNLNEFTEQVPLSLALMRVARGEAAGERHAKRLGAWESASVTVRDLTDGLPSAKGKESVPLVLQYIRDKNEAKLTPISQRVDFVEMGRIKAHLADPDKQSGKDRRKEMWRIGTAMESAALLLQRSRGRHVPVNVETAKRAQEYIQARVPATEPAEAEDEAVVAPPAPVAHVEGGAPGQHPPWLQRSNEPVVSATRADRVEVVPVSVSDDPSLYRTESPVPSNSSSPTSSSALPPPPARASASTPVAALPPPPPVDVERLKQEVQRDLLRFMEERMTVLTDNAAQRSTGALEGKISDAVEARMAPRVDELAQLNAKALEVAIAGLEARVIERIEKAESLAAANDSAAADSLNESVERRVFESTDAQGRAIAAATQQFQQQLAEAEERQGHRTTEQVSQTETRLKDSLNPIIQGEIDRRLRLQLEPRLAEVAERTELLLRQSSEVVRGLVKGDVERTISDLRAKSAEAETQLRTGLLAQLDLHL
ncbi:MAG: hypothetical protein L3J96_01440, partial [Thermoplasmata archaeon]|nr:hypothetical protein [Thermoplasmata archaeon]